MTKESDKTLFHRNRNLHCEYWHWERSWEFKTEPWWGRIEDTQGFGGNWDLSCGVRPQWAQTSVAAVILEISMHTPVNTQVTDLTQGFSGFLSRSRGCLLPCLKASQSLGLDQPPKDGSLTVFSWTAPAQFSAGCMFSIAATYHNFICLRVEMANNLHR